MQTTWREDLAWAAGFFDGEGWSGTMDHKDTGQRYAHMAIHQVHRPSLERFQLAVLGLGRINGPYANGRNKPIYKWQVSKFEDVQAVGMLILPFLGSEKTEQWADVMKRCARPLRNLPGKCGRGHEQARYRNARGQCRKCMAINTADYRARKAAKAA